jgi:hypothetical protein
MLVCCKVYDIIFKDYSWSFLNAGNYYLGASESLFNYFNNNDYNFAVVGRKEELVCCAERNVEIERNC